MCVLTIHIIPNQEIHFSSRIVKNVFFSIPLVYHSLEPLEPVDIIRNNNIIFEIILKNTYN